MSKEIAPRRSTVILYPAKKTPTIEFNPDVDSYEIHLRPDVKAEISLAPGEKLIVNNKHGLLYVTSIIRSDFDGSTRVTRAVIPRGASYSTNAPTKSQKPEFVFNGEK